jgi:uncharacterized protein YpmS
MSKGKKWLLALVVLLALVATAFIVFHDDNDMEAKEAEQQLSIDTVTTQENFDKIGDDLKEHEQINSINADSL